MLDQKQDKQIKKPNFENKKKSEQVKNQALDHSRLEDVDESKLEAGKVISNIKERKADGGKPALTYDYKMKLPGALKILVAALLFFAEVGLFLYLGLKLSSLTAGLYLFFQVLGLAFSIYLLQRYGENSYNIFWIMLILFFPAFGLIIYLSLGRKRRFKKLNIRFKEDMARIKPYRKEPIESSRLGVDHQVSDAAQIQINYLTNKGFPVYNNSAQTYFPSGEAQFTQMLQDMEKAEEYIFLEYFIMADGHILDKAVDIMMRKAQAGVDVRLLYDDFGVSARADAAYIQAIKDSGVKVITFNPVSRYISGFYKNYRNHQKLCLIDGKVGWLGGTNLADEYANIYERFGYWKDTAIRIEGEACNSLLTDFILMWDHDQIYPKDPDLSIFMPDHPRPETYPGLTIPFWDGPIGMDGNVSADLIRSLFTTAKTSIDIMTPYLVVEPALIDALCMAADSGVRVRLITPGIPDKPQVYLVTRSNYGKLIEHGCEIYEYTPGFIHAKTILVDNERVLLGSINLDYRSLYLNFENAVYICQSPVIADISQDVEETITVCEQISWEAWKNRPRKDKIREPFYKIMSPLM